MIKSRSGACCKGGQCPSSVPQVLPQERQKENSMGFYTGLGIGCDEQVENQVRGLTPSPRARETNGLVSLPLSGSLQR